MTAHIFNHLSQETLQLYSFIIKFDKSYKQNSGTPSTNYYIVLPNLHFHHLSIWIPYLSHLQKILSDKIHKLRSSIPSSPIYSKIDYCNSLFLNINSQQLNRLQLILNSTARAVTKTPKFHHITPHLKSLHWLKITQRIH